MSGGLRTRDYRVPRPRDSAGYRAFVGRAEQLRTIDAAWRAAVSGRRGVVLVLGEALFVAVDRDGVEVGRLRERFAALQAPVISRFLELYSAIQELPRHLGQHSGGMVICQGQLDAIVPLEFDVDSALEELNRALNDFVNGLVPNPPEEIQLSPDVLMNIDPATRNIIVLLDNDSTLSTKATQTTELNLGYSRESWSSEAGSLFLGVDSIFGPLYLGAGLAEGLDRLGDLLASARLVNRRVRYKRHLPKTTRGTTANLSRITP